jgi:two-component system response regulator FixJ
MPLKRAVYVVDDDAGVRRSLERLLHVAGFEAVSYETPFAFLEVARTLVPGCLLLDIRMPAISGLQIQERLIAMAVLLPVVIMTAQGDVATAVRAMKAGAADFIEKPFDDEVLLKTIESALERGSGRVGREQEVTNAVKRIGALSPREWQVLEGLVAGDPNKVIAYDLGLSVRTVEVHRARMMERLGVRQLAEAVRLAVLAKLAHAPGEPRS